MTKIHMKQTRQGTNDGFAVQTFQEGKTYEVSYSLAVYFASKDWAEIDQYSDIKEEILSNNKRYQDEKIRFFWNQFSIDRILNSNLEESQKIELLSLTKLEGAENE